MAEARKKSSRLIKVLLGVTIFTGGVFANTVVEELRSQYYFNKWVVQGTQEQKKRYWDNAPELDARLLIPFYSFLHNPYEDK